MSITGEMNELEIVVTDEAGSTVAKTLKIEVEMS